MREIGCLEITKAVDGLCKDANFLLPKDVIKALEKARENEESSCGRAVLDQILKNIQIATKEKIPLCQDCGTAVVFLEIGQDVHIVGGNFYNAIKQGVKKGYKNGYLRKSICHCFTRKNTNDNTPVIIHTDIVPGDKLKITFCPKGGGSENVSTLKMLKPAQGIDGIKNFVVESVKQAGANPCPPVVVGVGIGGTFETTALIAKKALLRKIGEHNKDSEIANLERECLIAINNLGIGPAGLGGRTTALAVHINMLPCHIASMPAVVNMNCHSARHKEITL